MGGAKTVEAIKAELGITDAQKAVWEGFAAVQTKAKAGMQDMQLSMKKMMDAKSPVERLDARLAAMELHLNSLKEFKAPLKALYDALSDEQKKKAATALAGVGCMM
jgi:pyridoxal biosynthesis lyase PdxS